MSAPIPSITDPESLPVSIRFSPGKRKIWGVLEFRSRTTLLVHGSEAVGVVKGMIDEKEVIAAMVKCGALIPIKIDLIGADRAARSFLELQYGCNLGKPRAAVRPVLSKWTVSFALLWTYEPGNRAPMRREPEYDL